MRTILNTIDRFVDWVLLGPHAGENPKSWRYDAAFGFSRRIGRLMGMETHETRSTR